MNGFDLRHYRGLASIRWRFMLPPHRAHDEPMAGQENQKRFVLHLYIFYFYLIVNKNTEKGMYLVIQERFSSNIWYVTIFFWISRIPETTSQYPVSQ